MYWQGENICKWFYWQGINFQNKQTGHTALDKIHKQSNQKTGRRSK